MIVDEVGYELDHSGVRGMKWGVRKRGRIERTRRVGQGKGSTLDKIRVHAVSNPIDTVRRGGFKKGATQKAKRMTARNARLAKKGEGKVRDYLAEIGTARITDALPSVRSSKLSADQKSSLKKMSSGKALMIAAPAFALWAVPKVARAASR